MQRIQSGIITFFIITLISSCSSVPQKNWTHLVPENTAFVVVTEDNLRLRDIPLQEYAPIIDDLTPTALQQIAALDSVVSNALRIKALSLYPATSTESHLLWIAENPNSNIQNWAPRFYRPFTQNKYQFGGLTIHKLFFNKNEVYAAQAGNWLVLSESSLVLENSLRSYTGQKPAMQFTEEPAPGIISVNAPKLDRWLEQFAMVSSRPSIVGSLNGTKPFNLRVAKAGNDTVNTSFELRGRIEMKPDSHSVLADALTYKNGPINLDRYIASNAAAFAIFRLPPKLIPSEPVENSSPLDSLLLRDSDLFTELAATLDDAFAFEAFPESGLLATGEYLFMRSLKNVSRFQDLLRQVENDGLITRQGSTYQINSSVFAQLVGSELCTFRDFYLNISGNVAVLARRKGLAESVEADRTRRRVIYYDETYSTVKDELPEGLSGFVWSYSDDFLQFIRPYLKEDHNAAGLLGRYDITTLAMQKSGAAIDLRINTYARQGSSLPYEELWVMPLSNFNLSGKPVLGDIVGSSTDEIIFATEDGRVIALASDGTIAMQTTTDGLKPLGSPVLYDWYGNGQQVILLAAGSRIYAWNNNGELLPKFPLEIGQKITAPILITDVLRNGIPEIVAATENRQVHVLDGRGENVRGWPQNTNAVVSSTPVFRQVQGVWSVWAFSQNALHSWLRNGAVRPGYPQFINAQFTHSPVFYNNQVLGSAADGHLYSIGVDSLFSDSLSTTISGDSISVQSLYVTNNELSFITTEPNVLLRDSTGFFREDLVVAQSLNGSLFLYNMQGELRATQSLGQPASKTLVPHLVDINSDQNQELIALAEFGRLYAWEVLTDERLYGIPTSGMKYPVITDLNGDGQKELIAETREGLRCWTINRGD